MTSEKEKSLISTKKFIITAVLDAAIFIGLTAALCGGAALPTLFLLFPGAVGLTTFLFTSYRSPLVLLPVLVSVIGAVAVPGLDVTLSVITAALVTVLSALNAVLTLKGFDPFTSKVWAVLLLSVIIGALSAASLSREYGDVMTGVDTVSSLIGDTAGEAADAALREYSENAGRVIGQTVNISSADIAGIITSYIKNMLPSIIVIGAMIMTYVSGGVTLISERITGVAEKRKPRIAVPPAALAVVYLVSMLVVFVSSILPDVVGTAAANINSILTLLFVAEAVRITVTMMRIGTGAKGKILPAVVFAALLFVFPNILPIISSVMIIKSSLRRRSNDGKK